MGVHGCICVCGSNDNARVQEHVCGTVHVYVYYILVVSKAEQCIVHSAFVVYTNSPTSVAFLDSILPLPEFSMLLAKGY